MYNKTFWEDVQKKWCTQAAPKIKDIKVGSGGEIDSQLLADPWNLDAISFDELDFDKAFEAGINGTEYPLKSEVELPKENVESPKVAAIEETKEPVPTRPQLDVLSFDACIKEGTLSAFAKAGKLLRACELPMEMDDVYSELVNRIPVLEEAVNKFGDIYTVDLTQFYEFYFPESLQLTATYLEYLNLEIDESIILGTEKEVMAAVKDLVVGVNDKINEIYQYASMAVKAEAKALDAIMNKDGYIGADMKLKMS